MSDALLDIKKVKDKVSMGTTKIYGLIKEGSFPKQIKVGRDSLWSEAEIDRWIEMQKQNRAA